jgi:glycosyltransferase involved in cell wall biosynthesis
MRIGVNLIPLRPGQMGGHEFYVRSLLKHLLTHQRRDQYFLFTAWWNDDSIDFEDGRYRKILAVPRQEHKDAISHGFCQRFARYPNLLALPLVRRWATRSPLDLHDWVRRLKLDLWFCPMTNLEPRHLPIPTLVTIADIQQEYYPEFFTREELDHRALMYLPSCQEATAVITVSKAARKSLIERYRLPGEKVHCVYEAGIERKLELRTAPSPEQVRQKYQLPTSYAFYPANLWPHKNHHMLILALHRLRKVYGVSLSLVLTGKDIGQWEMIEELVRHFQLQEQVRYVGYVAAEELPALYIGATMLVFPSLYEGFGLPLLEAMELGCPVAAANLTSIPEVVGDAALLFDPRNPDAMADACYQLLMSEDLRQTLVMRGRERVGQFSWEKAADETLKVFDWARSQRRAIQPRPRSQRSRIEGIYSDGWATRQVRLYLPYLPEIKAVKMEGVSAHVAYPLTIRMRINGRRVHKLSVAGPRKFAVVGEFDRARRAMAGVEVKIFADRDFAPTEVENGADTRKLAYRVEKLSLICIDGAETSLLSLQDSLNGMPVGKAAAQHG